MKRRGGFTLVEVVIGMTVASLALGAGFAALAIVQDRSDHANTSARAALAGATQRAMLVDWLKNALARAPTSEQFEGMDDLQSGEESDMLLVPTTARTPIDTQVSVVGLYIDVDPDTPQRGLVAELTGVRFGPGEPFEIAPEVAGMQIRYLPNIDGVVEWVDGWSDNGLPRGIEITLTAAPGDSLPLMLRLPIRVALGNGL